MSFEVHAEPAREALRPLIRHYTAFAADVGASSVTRSTPVRPLQFLQLVLEGEHCLRNIQTGRLVRSPRASLIGLCTYRKYDLIVSGRLRVFFVQFQPGAAFAWTGRDTAWLTDGCLPAQDAFGPDVETLCDRLAETAGLTDQIGVADAWFAARKAPVLDDIAAAARAMLDGETAGPVDSLSQRQFQRRFARQIGVTPKMYARLCRLAAVINRREAEPGLSWTELAHAGGYADQAHLTREFRSFVRAAPTRFRRYEFGEAA